MERKCGNCFHFQRDYFFGRDCCDKDEDDEVGTIHYANEEDDPCGEWELDLTITDERQDVKITNDT